ncbi:Uncharacterised protein [Campylobacter sputorum subsp. bubulus]|uniref:Uncharacterized protein n=1 Tax=Campylobacter sputorum subsp. sputorum TaxID=32024 RepID=A0A381DHT4_9BACT|nr:hypothetical protein [Campylobacter sputorum]KAB0581258.1 hypothetical protein F7P64_06445 [Campylobacter sputorum subsp. sputorum]SUX08867.1 Uncharacterised protein [Campylobacter sputorum subsp. bubulus]SUX09914.1 Uncharacterised protein [Campylobacter sputorum subsp. sputorum]
MRQINIEATKDLLKEMRKWSYNNDFLIVAWEPIYKDEFQGKYINNEKLDEYTDCIIDEWFKNDEPSKVDEDGEYHYFKSVDE